MARLARATSVTTAAPRQETSAISAWRLELGSLGVTVAEVAIALLWGALCSWAFFGLIGVTAQAEDKLRDVLFVSLNQLRALVATVSGIVALGVVQKEVRRALLPAIARWTRTEHAIWQFLLTREDRLPVPLEEAAEAFVKDKASHKSLATVTLDEWAGATEKGAFHRYSSVEKLIGRLSRREGSSVPPLIRFALRSPDRESREAAIRWMGTSLDSRRASGTPEQSSV